MLSGRLILSTAVLLLSPLASLLHTWTPALYMFLEPPSGDFHHEDITPPAFLRCISCFPFPFLWKKKRLIFTISATLHSFSFPIHLLGKLLCLFDVWRQTYLYTAAAARVFQSVWTFTFDRNTVAARALQKTITYRVSESDKEVN